MPDRPPHPVAPARPLEAVAGLDAGWVAILQSHWLNTVEEVLAIAASPTGREGLRKALSTGEEPLCRFIAVLEDAVGPERAQRLRHPPPPAGRTGAWLTERQKEQFGLE